MPSDLKKAIYDSLTAGKQGVQAAFNPMRLGGPDVAGGLRAALFGGLGAATVPMMAMDEAALGVGNVISEDTGRAAAAVERAGYPSMAKGLAGGGVALGMAPFIGGMALDPEMGAAKAAGAGVLERLAASNLPESVLRKAESLQALHGEKALADLVQEYADRGVPLFSHDLPMDEAARMGRAKEMRFSVGDAPSYHGSSNPIKDFDLRKTGKGSGADLKAVFSSDSPKVAEDFADLAAFSNAQRLPLKKRPNQLSGQNITPIVENTDGLLVKEAKDVSGQSGLFLKLEKAKAALQEAKDEGLGGAYFKGVRELTGDGDTSNVMAILNPKNIRSPYAAFDPRMKDSKFLLALKAGAIPLAGISAFSQGEQ